MPVDDVHRTCPFQLPRLTNMTYLATSEPLAALLRHCLPRQAYDQFCSALSIMDCRTRTDDPPGESVMADQSNLVPFVSKNPADTRLPRRSRHHSSSGSTKRSKAASASCERNTEPLETCCARRQMLREAEKKVAQELAGLKTHEVGEDLEATSSSRCARGTKLEQEASWTDYDNERRSARASPNARSVTEEARLEDAEKKRQLVTSTPDGGFQRKAEPAQTPANQEKKSIAPAAKPSGRIHAIAGVRRTDVHQVVVDHSRKNSAILESRSTKNSK